MDECGWLCLGWVQIDVFGLGVDGCVWGVCGGIYLGWVWRFGMDVEGCIWIGYGGGCIWREGCMGCICRWVLMDVFWVDVEGCILDGCG